MSSTAKQQLATEHSVEAIQDRLSQSTQHSYLRDFVYGGIDGAVTTFAIVSGVAGAELSSGVVIVLGLANLVGDGFSMAASNYLGSKADLQLLEQARATEESQIRKYPEGEREEIRQIMAAKGFEGEALESVVHTITADRKLWVDTMLQEELGFSLDRPDPLRAALVTFFAFLVVGFLPLVSFITDYLWPNTIGDPFYLSIWLTGVAFVGVGAVKSRFVAGRWYIAGLETLVVGGVAAAIAYSIGLALRGIV